METKDLLNYTKQIILEQKEKREESGGYFNIFSIASGYESPQVVHVYVLTPSLRCVAGLVTAEV